MLRYWKNKGLGVEVVSEFEFKAALFEKFKSADILINGVAKHNWLKKYTITGLKVHIDSLYEFDCLKDSIKQNKWQIGLRFNVNEEYDPDETEFRTQFGLSKKETAKVLLKAKKESIRVFGIHFHLRSDIADIKNYQNAIKETVALCKELNFSPTYIDIGGGLPSSGERPILNLKTKYDFHVNDFKLVLDSIKALPSIKEVWMENGKFITAKSGVLVVKVLDIKDKADSRYLICDSGRTNNCFVSDWEDHDFFFFPQRKGDKVHTTICGPTCMAYDRFFRKKLPNDIKIGDYFVWMNAGAYHKSWETRFSNGLNRIIWYNANNDIKVIRDKEDFYHWWNN
ncbi:MAG: hypothetical protein ACXAC7_23890 [Candidatus Hodarchaeales archaeon]